MDKKWIILFIAWIVATTAMGGSLFFSEVMRFRPCSMCWYQRIAMYPLFLIFIPPLINYERSFIKYSFPLAIIGWFWAVYHNLLHWKIIPKSAAPCIQGVPCSTVYINWGGFITIPFLSLTAFTLILICLGLLYKEKNHEL